MGGSGSPKRLPRFYRPVRAVSSADMQRLPGQFLIGVFSADGAAYDGEICHTIIPGRY
jgi:hypothetical protein